MPVTNIGPPPGSPRPVETPRTKRLREVRLKRLAYFENQQSQRGQAPNKQEVQEVSTQKANDSSTQHEDKENSTYKIKGVLPNSKTSNDIPSKEGSFLPPLKSVDGPLKPGLLNGQNSDVPDSSILRESMVKDSRVKSVECNGVIPQNATLLSKSIASGSKDLLLQIPSNSSIDVKAQVFYRPESQNSVLRADLESEKQDLFGQIAHAKAALNRIGSMDTPLPNVAPSSCVMYSPRTFDNEAVSNAYHFPACKDELRGYFSDVTQFKLPGLGDDRLSIVSDETVESHRMYEPLSVRNHYERPVLTNGHENNIIENGNGCIFNNSMMEDNIQKCTDNSGMSLDNNEPVSSRSSIHTVNGKMGSLPDDFLSVTQDKTEEIPMVHIPSIEETSDSYYGDHVPEMLTSRTQEDFKETWESLEGVLGKSRLTRLMKNLRETDQVLGEDPNMVKESVDENMLKSIWFDLDNSDDDGETATLKKKKVPTATLR